MIRFILLIPSISNNSRSLHPPSHCTSTHGPHGRAQAALERFILRGTRLWPTRTFQVACDSLREATGLPLCKKAQTVTRQTGSKQTIAITSCAQSITPKGFSLPVRSNFSPGSPGQGTVLVEGSWSLQLGLTSNRAVKYPPNP